MGKGYDYTKLSELAEEMRIKTGADYLSISFYYPPDSNVLKVVAGMTPVQRNLINSMGITLEGQNFPVKEGTITYKIRKEKKTQINDSFYIQLDRLVPKRLADMLQSATRIKRFIDIPLLDNGEIFGEAIISFCKDYPKSQVKKLEKILEGYVSKLKKFAPTSKKTSKNT